MKLESLPMRLSFYCRYAIRSLRRDALRTTLAILCIAIAVMTLVTLQLAGHMVSLSLLSNVRDLNGGDVSISAVAQPLTRQDLTFFDHLQQQGTLARFTPLWIKPLTSSHTQGVALYVVQPASYPVVSPPQWLAPEHGTFSTLLQGDDVVVDQKYAQSQQKRLGDRIQIQTIAMNDTPVTFSVRIAGIVASTGHFALSNGLIFISEPSFHTLTRQHLVRYNALDLSTNGDPLRADIASKAITRRFPGVTPHTAAQLQVLNQQGSDVIQKFLQSIGLLVLLIAGTGIMNTIQVFLSQRAAEIAILKTVGYRRRDLYLLFGLETLLLGLCGGIAGTLLSTGASYVFYILLQGLFSMLTLTFALDPWIISGGVGIGIATSLIFGWLPVVRAGGIRPISLLHELPGKERRTERWLVQFVLVLFLSSLFWLMAGALLQQDWRLSFLVVYGAIAVLLILALIFAGLVKAVGRIPFPRRGSEQYHRYLLIIGFFALSAVLFCIKLPAFGTLFLAALLILLVMIFLLPETWRMSLKMALRNLDRRRMRTTASLVVLFVGIFAVSVILILGLDLYAGITQVERQAYNLVLQTDNGDGITLTRRIPTIDGIDPRTVQAHLSTTIQVRSTQNPAIASGNHPLLLPVEGFDLAHQQHPDESWLHMVQGRTLTAEDAQTQHVLLNETAINAANSQKIIGSQLLLTDSTGKRRVIVTVVGIFRPAPFYFRTPIIAPQSLVARLTQQEQRSQIIYMHVDPSHANDVFLTLTQLVPNVTYVFNSVSLIDLVQRFFNAGIAVLLALGGISILTALAVIANTVALALLEQQRELGILKAVGYTGLRLVLIVLVENSVIGMITALIAVIPVTLAASLLDTYILHAGFQAPWYLLPLIIVGTVGAVGLTASLVASSIIRMRPLEILRYE